MKKKILILPLMTFMFMSAFVASSIGANPSVVYAEDDSTQENPAKELFNPDSAEVYSTWGQFENPEATWNKASQTLTIEIKQQGEWQWANQVFFSTGITKLDTSKEYQFSFTGTASTDDCGEVTFKAFDDFNPLVYLDQNLSFTTTPYNYVSEWATPLETSTNGCIVFDFGWDAAQTVTITNISIKERSKAVSYTITNFDFTTNLYGHKGVSSGSGSEYVADGDIAVGEKFIEEPTQIEFTVNGSTQTRFWNASSKHELRLYKGATFVLSVVGNYKITKVEFTGSAVNLDANGETVSDKVWEGNATKLITFVNTATTSKINSIKVTCIAIDPSAEIPTITPNEEASVYWKPITVTLGCTTEGAAIHYTLDGSNPTTESAVYSEPISISATTTVKAMAAKEGLSNSEVVSKTFTFGTVFASLEELVEKQPATDDIAYVEVTITNAVIDDFYVSSKGYTNGIYVTAASTTVEFYCNDVPETWEIGGKVSGKIKAEWLLYKGTPELQKWEGGWDAFTYTAPTVWPADAPTEAPAAPTHDGTSLLGAPLTTNLEFEPLDWPGSMPEKLTFETGETIYYMEKMNWQIYTNWAEDSYDMSEYDMLHVDLFPSTGTEIKVTFEGLGASDGGQGYKNSVVKTLIAGEWNGLDIALSEFPGLISGDAYDFSDIKYLILEGYDADQTALSVGNVYFYKDSTPKEIKYTTYENWQIKYGNEWTWSDNMDKIEDGLYKIEIFWEGTGFNVKSDDNPIKKDWYDINDPDVIIADECIAPVTVDVYLKVIDDETLKIGIGEVPHEPHEHAIKTTHAKVEAKCVEAGHEVYYECDCGKYFSDQALTQEIEDLETWLAEDGGGYLAPLGHHFSGDVTYTWEGDQCTASWKCDHAGCNEVQTETVTGVYVKDSDATTESNEKGHYEATFSLPEFGTNSTAPNSVEKPNTKLASGLSGGAIAGIVIGSVFGLLIIAFVVLYILWKRKNLNVPILSKVLTPAFRFINKLFFKTKLNDVEAKEAENKVMKE